jgi:Protein of unknown function (DUF1501)
MAPAMLNLGQIRSRSRQGITRRAMLEFGRCSALGVAGGGTPGGAVIGGTTADGGHPATRPNHPVDVLTTILEKMRLDRLSLLVRNAGVLASVIPELV